MNNKLRPAIIGGLVLGVLSAIPFVNIANCCCLWVLLGGALATYLYIKSSPTPVQIGEGAMLGVMAGVIGGLINLFIGVPLNILVGNPIAGLMVKLMERLNPQQADAVRQQLEQQTSGPFSEQLLRALPGAIFGFLIIVAFATVGGLVAVPLFEKRKGEAALPPPPNTGGPQGGSYGTGI